MNDRRGWTRRDCGRGLLAGVFANGLRAAAGETGSIGNELLRLDLGICSGRVSRRFHNLLSDEAVELPGGEFELEFLGDGIVSSSSLQARIVTQRPGRLELMFAGDAAWEVRVRYDLPPGKAYLRKQIQVRRKAGTSRLLRADIEDWRGVKRSWDSMHHDSEPFGSHPIFCDTMWAGVEFVAAFNRYDGSGFVLRSRPGGKAVGTEWLPLRSTVVGVAEPKGVREAFLRYIEDIRLARPRLVACYNAWWTLPLHVKHDEQLALFRELKARLFDRHGVFFDLVATDEGWTDNHSIWEIDRRNLPNGFDDARAIVESAGGRLGLWMSPSENYPRTCDYEWAEKSGYTVVRPEINPFDDRLALSLADPKYRAEAEEQLKRLIREYGFGHIKYDGFTIAESRPHHDLLPGQDSVEPLAEALMELFSTAYEANPHLFSEPTCLNSRRNYISPWIIRHANSLWGDAGTDCPPGIGPAPVYRESATSGREFYIFGSLDEVWLPQNALQYFDIVHCDPGGGFANHAAMAFGRGRFFISTYANPKFMSEDDWRIYAGLLRWGRTNQDILQHTVMLRSRIELGEPYVYGHWLGTRGILAVRNPSNESKKLQIDLASTGAPAGLTEAVCYTQYPYRRGVATDVTGMGTVSLRLAPWELVFLEIQPRSALKESVALGARWFHDARAGMSIVPDAKADKVRILLPDGHEQVVAVEPRLHGEFRGELISHSMRKLAEGEWVTQERTFPCNVSDNGCPNVIPLGRRFPGVAFDVECSVAVPVGGGAGRVLLLVEFPGEQHLPSKCTAAVNGNPVRLEERYSEGHIAYRDSLRATGAERVRPYLSEWTWYICEAPEGTSRVRFTGTAGDTRSRIGLWAWMETDLTGRHVPVSVPSSEAKMPQYEAERELDGLCLKSPEGGSITYEDGSWE